MIGPVFHSQRVQRTSCFFVEVKDAHVTDTPTLPFDPQSVRGACAIDYAQGKRACLVADKRKRA